MNRYLGEIERRRKAMWRQGDVLIEAVSEVPENLPRVKRLVLASGDNTAQRHEIKERGVAELFGDPARSLYLVVKGEEATVVHPEHGPIVLKKGQYRVWRQREFAGTETRRVLD
jgi:hypothetical protein